MRAARDNGIKLMKPQKFLRAARALWKKRMKLQESLRAARASETLSVHGSCKSSWDQTDEIARVARAFWPELLEFRSELQKLCACCCSRAWRDVDWFAQPETGPDQSQHRSLFNRCNMCRHVSAIKVNQHSMDQPLTYFVSVFNLLGHGLFCNSRQAGSPQGTQLATSCLRFRFRGAEVTCKEGTDSSWLGLNAFLLVAIFPQTVCPHWGVLVVGAKAGAWSGCSLWVAAYFL